MMRRLAKINQRCILQRPKLRRFPPRTLKPRGKEQGMKDCDVCACVCVRAQNALFFKCRCYVCTIVLAEPFLQQKQVASRQLIGSLFILRLGGLSPPASSFPLQISWPLTMHHGAQVLGSIRRRFCISDQACKGCDQ